MENFLQQFKLFANTLCNKGYDFTVAKKWLKAKGFEFLDSGCFYDGFVDPEHKIVVKILIQRINRNWKRGRAIFPLRNHPVAEYFLYPLFCTPKKEMIIQPYAETTDQGKAYDKLASAVDYFDFVDCNVGWYKGQAVIFDYMNLQWYLNLREQRKHKSENV